MTNKECQQCLAMIQVVVVVRSKDKEKERIRRRCRKIALQGSEFCDKHQKWTGPIWHEPIQEEKKQQPTDDIDTISERLDQMLNYVLEQKEEQAKWQAQMNELIETMTIQCDSNRLILDRMEALTKANLSKL